MRTKKFKVGDLVTFKSREKAGGNYRFGGQCQGGKTGKIRAYREFASIYKCFEISVDFDSNNNYSMLESEFKEWDEVTTSTSELFPIF